MGLKKLPSECKGVVPAECDNCSKEYFIRKGQASNSVKQGYRNYYCSKACQHIGLVKWKITPCPNCEIAVKGPNTFCSRSCAAQYNNPGATRSPELRAQISAAVSKYHAENPDSLKRNANAREAYKLKPRLCIMCGNDHLYEARERKTCSATCLKDRQIMVGRHLAQFLNKRSKDEIALFEQCCQHWQCEANPILFKGYDADITIPLYRLAIMWDGPWHYQNMPKKLKHNLASIRRRDAYKIRKLTEIGWTVLVYRDCDWKPDTAFTDVMAVVDLIDRGKRLCIGDTLRVRQSSTAPN